MKEIEYLIDAVETVRRHGKPEIASWLDNAVNQYLNQPQKVNFRSGAWF